MEAPTRLATGHDVHAIARIYNEGIAERITFETEARTPSQILEWLGRERQPLLVALAGDEVAGWARVAPYSTRACYSGVGEASVYVAGHHRRQGLGAALAAGVIGAARSDGYYKLLAKLFTDNDGSLRLVRRLGFREVGTHLRHGRLDGRWRDVLLVELLLGDAAGS
jgi:phosphinothricin acetyltransferase